MFPTRSVGEPTRLRDSIVLTRANVTRPEDGDAAPSLCDEPRRSTAARMTVRRITRKGRPKCYANKWHVGFISRNGSIRTRQLTSGRRPRVAKQQRFDEQARRLGALLNVLQLIA